MTREPTTPLPRASSAAAPAGRSVLDSLVQASLVDLFAAYQVALAPLPVAAGASSAPPEVSIAVAFRHRQAGDPGRMTLSLSSSLLDHMKGGELSAVKLDWARELASQLAGRIKNRLLPFGVRLEIGSLALLSPQVLQHQLERAHATRIYTARTLRGLVLVTLQGLPDESTLSYAGSPSAAEGTMIWL